MSPETAAELHGCIRNGLAGLPAAELAKAFRGWTSGAPRRCALAADRHAPETTSMRSHA